MKTIINTLFLILISASLFSQQTIIKCFNISSTTEWEIMYDAKPTPENQIVITGIITDPNWMAPYSFLMKLDAELNIIWAKKYMVANSYCQTTVLEVTDDGYLLMGNQWPSAPNGNAVFVLKTDTSGNVQWSNLCGGNFANTSCKTRDGNVLIATAGGWSNATSSHTTPQIIKLDVFGNVLWSYAYGNSFVATGDNAFAITETLDKGIIVTGSMVGPGTITSSLFLLKTDSSGHVLWTKMYDGVDTVHSLSPDFGLNIIATSDSGFIVSGIGSQNYLHSNVVIMKVDKEGNYIWGKTLNDCNEPGEIHYTIPVDDGYVSIYSGFSIYIEKFDSTANTIWKKKFPFYSYGFILSSYLWQSSPSEFTFVVQLYSNNQEFCVFRTTDAPDSCSEMPTTSCDSVYHVNVSDIIMARHSRSGDIDNTATDSTMTFNQVDICGTTTAVIELSEKKTVLNIFPNISGSEINLYTEVEGAKKLTLFDISGRELVKYYFSELTFNFPVSNLSNGIYILKISDEAGLILSKKICVSK